jgi:hypothetical protein
MEKIPMMGAATIPHQTKSDARPSLSCYCLLLIVCAPLVAFAAARLLIVRAEVPSPDAIIVLSGSSTYLERASWAAKLYREGRAPLIVLTNDGVRQWLGQSRRSKSDVL